MVNGLGFMNASKCIYMCYGTKRNRMKTQAGSPDLGSRGKSLFIFVLCFILSLFFIFYFQDSFVDNFCTGLKTTFGIGVISASRGCLFY